MLIGFGIKAKMIRKCAGTGFIVDVMGTGTVDKTPGRPTIIALRTDLDGLPMPENNQSLSYKT